MANKEITDLTSATVLDGTELVHVDQGSNSRKATSRQLASLGLSIFSEAGTAVSAIVSDNGKWIRFTAVTPIVWTIDTGIFNIGDEVTIEQAAVGVLTVTSGVGITINSRGGRIITNGQFSVATLKCVGVDEFVLVGDLV